MGFASLYPSYETVMFFPMILLAEELLERMMADDRLFGELPEQSAPRAETVPQGRPRLRELARDQVELQAPRHCGRSEAIHVAANG
jgi:hypothetical protein